MLFPIFKLQALVDAVVEALVGALTPHLRHFDSYTPALSNNM